MKLVDADALKNQFDCSLYGLEKIHRVIDNAPDASQPLREMIRRLADELSNATDPIVSLCLDKEECRSLVYEARALLKESDHA